MNAWRWRGPVPVDTTPPERRIPPASQASAPATAIILVSVGVFVLGGVLQGDFYRIPLWALGTFVVLTLCAAMTSSTAALHVTVFCSLVVFAYRSPGMAMHPFPLMVALGGYGVVVVATARLRETTFWLHTGSLELGVIRLVLIAVVVAGAALPAWYLLTNPKVDPVVAVIAELPLWALLPIGVFFALVNAGAEEAAFRGILMYGLQSAVGIPGALLIQAAVFGLVHYSQGVPSGAWGALLSGVYGFLLGVIRLQAGGMLAPWIAHAATDLMIFTMLVLVAK
jgi:membrane protease YdiL (CAAX protease family)